MRIYGAPTEPTLYDSLHTILDQTLRVPVDATSDSYDALYLVGQSEDISVASNLASDLRHTEDHANVFINTLYGSKSIELQSNQVEFNQPNVSLINDYSNPHTSVDKRVSFFSSDQCRPFIRHVFGEVVTMITPILDRHEADVAPIGSEALPDFPCKLDVDLVVCTDSSKRYKDIIRSLQEEGTFNEPRDNLDGYHRFFYTELMGAPIDLHVINQSMNDCFLRKQIAQLAVDAELRDSYRQFKLEAEGSTISEYRAGKAEFRKKVGWD
jgi:GrpB-like predicted nucleotidyltransferase (UPF0157 family)